MAGNTLVAIASKDVVSTGFTADNTAPFLVEFDLSMDGAGLLTMTFSETMKATSLDVSQITFQFAETLDDHTFELSDGTSLSRFADVSSFCSRHAGGARVLLIAAREHTSIIYLSGG
jgi:hypothetical protein